MTAKGQLITGRTDPETQITNDISQQIIDVVNGLTEKAYEPMCLIELPSIPRYPIVRRIFVIWDRPSPISSISTSGAIVSVWWGPGDAPEYFCDTDWTLHKLLYEALAPLFDDLAAAHQKLPENNL